MTGEAWGIPPLVGAPPSVPGWVLSDVESVRAASARLGESAVGDTTRSVTVSGRAYGGWSVEPVGNTSVEVPPMGRAAVAYTLTPGADVRPSVDYPLVFDAVVDDMAGDAAVSPSVSRVQRPADKRGKPVSLAPSIADLAPANGVAVTGPDVTVSARITDRLSGVNPARVEVEVDGAAVPSRFEPGTGVLTAELRLARGPHEVWIRAHNRAHAPTQASARVAVR